MKKILSSIVFFLLVFFSFALTPIVTLHAFNDQLLPEISHVSGLYDRGFNLTLTLKPQTTVYYTLDSSTPHNQSSSYENPIFIDEVWIDKDSEITTITHDNPYQSGPLSFIVTAPEKWEKPKDDIFGATVFKYIVVDNNTQSSSNVITHTYFIHPDMFSRYQFPMMSLSTDVYNLVDFSTGIHIPGVHYNQVPSSRTGNYFQRGDSWEKDVYVEYFDKSGILVLSQQAGLRIHGGLSRKYPIKSYRLYARKAYGESQFNYAFFDDKDIDTYKRLILRNGGQGYQYTFFGEAFVQSLLKPLTLDIQYSTPIILFINGEYFGIRNIRDRFDVHYLESHYNIDPNQSSILTGHAYLEDGSIQGQAHYQMMYSFITMFNMAVKANYEKAKRMMDMDNYIDYMIVELFSGNIDWPQNNIFYWRKNTTYNPNAPYGHDGRWRFMVNDLDASFGVSWGTVTADVDSFKRLTGDSWKTGRLFMNLLENDEFRSRFIYRMLYLMDTIFEEEHVKALLDEMVSLYEPHMKEHINRFGYPKSVSTWLSYVGRMYRFIEQREDYMINYMEDFFDIEEKHTVEIQYNQLLGGIDIYGKQEQSGYHNQTYYQHTNVKINAKPKNGYRVEGWYVNGQKVSSNDYIIVNPELDYSFNLVFEEGSPHQENINVTSIVLYSLSSLLTIGNIVLLSQMLKKRKKMINTL